MRSSPPSMLALLICAGVALSSLVLPAAGQQLALGGLKADPKAPVEVTSDSLSVNQQDGSAVFTGNVLVVQGGMRLKAEAVTVDYNQTNKNQIDTMHATGGVTIVSPDEAAQGREAVYNVATGKVVMTGDVLLTQGQNVMTGQRLNVDLRSGTGQMDGRVRTILQPQQGQKP